MAQASAVDQFSNALESQLLQELKSIELRISELLLERSTIERLIVSVRRSNPITIKTDVTRKNSVKRVLIESVVLENLRNAKRRRKTAELYAEMQMIDPRLKSNTFRSTLHRMKAKGVIFSPKDGQWEVPSPAT